ncbi:MAG: hypothetical protein HOC23_18495 [Halieaceae bacterium]|jgi:SEC-C motif domain protein|nr:hypothetical protein [Halieaceae bacterium]
MAQKICYCGRKKPPAKCCERFLSGRELPKTVEQLMRSRYSAYALGGRGRYLLDTWFPPTAVGLNEESLSSPGPEWLELKVHRSSQDNDKGTVEFSARYKTAAGAEEIQHEKSVFQRLAGRWYYVGGEVSK